MFSGLLKRPYVIASQFGSHAESKKSELNCAIYYGGLRDDSVGNLVTRIECLL